MVLFWGWEVGVAPAAAVSAPCLCSDPITCCWLMLGHRHCCDAALRTTATAPTRASTTEGQQPPTQPCLPPVSVDQHGSPCRSDLMSVARRNAKERYSVWGNARHHRACALGQVPPLPPLQWTSLHPTAQANSSRTRYREPHHDPHRQGHG